MPIAAANGIKLNYQIQGKGNPLVMIMGLGSSQSSWRFQTPAFKKYFQVITFDNRGVGNSDKPPGPYSTWQMADDTLGLMDHLNIKKAHILGVSLGGLIAQELAINYPDRISKLVLGCTYACHDSINGRATDYHQAMAAFIESGKVPSAKLLFNKWQYQLIGGWLLRRQHSRMNNIERASFAAQFAAAGKHNTLDRLSAIKAPTLVIVGTGDKAIRPSSSETLARLIPGARLVKINGGSHTFPAEMRNAFNREVLNFLQNH